MLLSFSRTVYFVCQTRRKDYFQQRIKAEKRVVDSLHVFSLAHISPSSPMQAELNPSRHESKKITPVSREICNSQKNGAIGWKCSHLPSTKSINSTVAVPLLFLLYNWGGSPPDIHERPTRLFVLWASSFYPSNGPIDTVVLFPSCISIIPTLV